MALGIEIGVFVCVGEEHCKRLHEKLLCIALSPSLAQLSFFSACLCDQATFRDAKGGRSFLHHHVILCIKFRIGTILMPSVSCR